MAEIKTEKKILKDGTEVVTIAEEIKSQQPKESGNNEKIK